MNKYLLAALIFLFIELNAQPHHQVNITNVSAITDSVNIDPNSFFPMDKGNFWQYAFLNDIVREEYVSKDSLLPDGSRLIYVAINNIVYNLPQWFIDTNYNVFLWGFNPEVMSVYYKLDAQIGEEWWMSRSSHDSLQGEFRRVESIYNGYYFGKETVFKEIFQFSRELIGGEYIDLLRSRETLASGLGVVLKYINDSWVRPPEYLVSAIINGDTLGIITDVDEGIQTPNEFYLSQNFPNPFNPITNIRFRIADFGFVSLKVYGVLGNEIRTLVNEEKPAGEYEVTFNGSGLASGVYVYRLTAYKDDRILFNESNQMILMK